MSGALGDDDNAAVLAELTAHSLLFQKAAVWCSFILGSALVAILVYEARGDMKARLLIWLAVGRVRRGISGGALPPQSINPACAPAPNGREDFGLQKKRAHPIPRKPTIRNPYIHR